MCESHNNVGDCILAENNKEVAYRKIPEENNGGYLQVFECRECNRKWNFILENHRGRDIGHKYWGHVELEEILNWYGVE